MSIRQSGRRRAGILAGLSAAALYLLWRQLRRPARMPHTARWGRLLARRYGPDNAGRYLNGAEQRFQQLCAGYLRPRHPVLNYHVTYQILPALAMYQTLSEELADSVIARDVVEQLVWAEIRPTYRAATIFLASLPNPFPFWRSLVRVAMKTIFPPAGWRARSIVDMPQCYGFDIVGCIYLDTLQTLDAPELATIFCQMDDRLAQLIPPSIGWRRAGTLARGQAQCDFRWVKQERKGSTR